MDTHDIRGTLESLEAGLEGEAGAFGYKPKELAAELRFVAFSYVVSRNEYRASRTRGAVLNTLADMECASEARLAVDAGKLGDEELAAAFGTFPNAGLKLHGIDNYADVYVPERIDLEVSAFKKMVAVRSRKEAPLLFRVEDVSSGIRRFWTGTPEELRAMLASAARAMPDVIRGVISHARGILAKTFQLDGRAGGRNQKVVSGFIEPPEWAMMNAVLDLIWPIEKGSMHSSKMEHARNIVHQLILYIDGSRPGEQGESRKTKSGLTTIGEDEDDSASRHRITGEYRFDKVWFSTILTYRHQVNTLRRAVKFVEQRKLALQASDDMMPDHIWRRLERLDRVAFYPLLDWRRELERRLREADYRTSDDTVRRPTGGVFGIPDVPKMKADLPPSQVAIKLIHAWKHYDAKKTAPNKGKIKNKITGKFEFAYKTDI